ncbi:hypothetical protein NQ315_008328, partial [Exocentrus adspersus]
MSSNSILCGIGDRFIAKLDEVFKLVATGNSATSSKKWVKSINHQLRLHYQALRNSESLGISRKLHTHIAHLKRYKHLFNSLAHVGAGHKNTRSRRVHWEDINSVFAGRIRTGIIINKRHIDVQNFLDDAYFLFKTRINKILRNSFQTMKVNAVFCGEFIKQSKVSESHNFKYFNTKNAIIDLGTELKTWFQDNIIDKILNKLDQFSEKDSNWALYKILNFEAMLEPLSEESSTKSTKYQKHTAFSVGYYFKCSYDDNLSFYKSHRGADCVQWFSNELETISKFIDTKLTTVVPMNMSQVQEMEFRLATICHICEKPFKDTEDHKKTRDHNHLTGMYRGASHNSCNLNYKNSFSVPIVLHNLSNYDGHFIISEVAKTGSIYLLPINKERYISFTKTMPHSNIKFRFIDSFRFLAESLDKLSSYLTNNELLNLRKEFHDLDDGKFKLLTRKGVFPYDYIDKIDKLQVTQLPDQEEFYNKLMDNNISDEDYRHAQNIWNKFEIKNL